jgi:protein CpxP
MIRRVRSTIAVVTAAVVLAAGFSTAVLAQGGPRGERPFGPLRWGGAGLPLQALDLTEAQRDQIRDVMQRHREEMREAGKRLGDAHRAQREAMQTVPVNEGLIRSTSQALVNAQTEMALLRARIYNEAWTILTPEQQSKAKEIKATREARAKQRAERRPRREG